MPKNRVFGRSEGGEINYPAILHLPVTSNSPSIYHPISRRKPYENQHGCCAKTFLDRHSLLHFTPPPSAQAAGDTADIRHKLWSDFDDFASIAKPPKPLVRSETSLWFGGFNRRRSKIDKIDLFMPDMAVSLPAVT